MEEMIGGWVEKSIISVKDIPSLCGIMVSINSIAFIRADFPEGTYQPTIQLIAEALAARLSGKGDVPDYFVDNPL